jgi:flavin reductase (DIM6/NTAB) family NADH-FMN oxidoreductase RutF
MIPEPQIQDRYDLFFGEVVAAWADKQAFKNGHWSFEDGGSRSIHYVSGGNFFETGEAFEIER